MSTVSSQISCGLIGNQGLSSRWGKSGSRMTLIASRVRPARSSSHVSRFTHSCSAAFKARSKAVATAAAAAAVLSPTTARAAGVSFALESLLQTILVFALCC